MVDDSAIPPESVKPNLPLWRRVRAWTIICGIYALLLGMVWWSINLVSSVIKPGVAWDDRAYKLLGAAALLVIPGKVAWVFIKRKLVTGSWLVMTPEEKAKVAARRAARQCSATQGAACRRPRQPWITYAVNWASHRSGDQNARLLERTLAWTVIVLYAAYVLFWAAFGLMGIVASFADDNTARQQFLWILLGLACLVYPALVIRANFRRFQATGSLRVSQEEFQSASAQRQEVQNKQRQMPLRNKIISYAVGFVVAGLMWMRATVHHSSHPHESWVSPAILTISLLYAIWRDFSKPPQTQSQASGSFSTTQD
jgi:hypothetical protein